MKKLTSVSLIALALLFFSCTKNAEEMLKYEGRGNSQMRASTLPILPGGITYCGEKTVPLCAGQNINIGTVKVRTATDGNVYITYKTTGLWFLKKLHLYAGPQSGIPTNSAGNPVPGQFPWTRNFNAPYTVQEYTFVLSNMPESFVVAAHAEVVKVQFGIPQPIQQETAWGDGCAGLPINGTTSGNWGTMFYYNQINCYALPEICSYPVNYYFDTIINGLPVTWPDMNGNGNSNGVVTVATFNYTETQGRAIFDAQNPNGIEPVSKRAFANIATIKLSATNFYQDPMLLEAITTTEAWLLTLGKLSPSNLPTTYNPVVTTAVNYTSAWIQMFECPDR